MFEELKEMMCNYIEVDPETITPESEFINDLGFNSFDFMCLLGEIEEKYNIHVDEEEIMGLSTVKDAIKYIEKLRKEH